MKKKLFSIVLCMVCMAGASAQSRWSVTPKAGIVVSNFNNEMYNGLSLDLSNHVDFTVGADVEYSLSDYVGLLSGINYNRVGGKYEGVFLKMSDQMMDYTVSDITDKLYYLQIPLMVNVYLTKGLAIKGGLQLGAKVGTKETYHYVLSTIDMQKYPDPIMVPNGKDWRDFENITIEGDESGSVSDVRTLDFGIPLGASYEYKNIVLDARYYLGLSNITSANNAKMNTRYLSVTLGYKFHLK